MRALLTLAVVVLCLGACARKQPPAPVGPLFKPETWFAGRMHSTGTLKPILQAPHRLIVQSDGRRLPDGSLRLDQAIHWSGGNVEHRFWIMRRAPNGYAVSLTDARGPVAFDVTGARAYLRYQDRRGPLIVEQWMDLQPDGRTLANRGRITVFGIPVAKLDEIIVHDPI